MDQMHAIMRFSELHWKKFINVADNSENLAGLGVRYLHFRFFFFHIQGICVYTYAHGHRIWEEIQKMKSLKSPFNIDSIIICNNQNIEAT